MDSLSIIIINYNTYEVTCNCLRSIFNSNIGDIDLQVIVVDNGSTEHCLVPFERLFPHIIYVKTERNLGFAQGNNVGIAYATKTYLLLLNSDTLILDPNTFQKSIDVVKENGDRIALTTKLLTVDGRAQSAYGFLPGLLYEFVFTSFLYKLFSKRKKAELLITFSPNESRIIANGYITATFLLFPKALLRVLPENRLYENTFMYAEELYWATNWLKQGIKMYYLAEVSIVHLVGESSKHLKGYSNRVRKRQLMASEDKYLRWRYAQTTVFLIYALRTLRFLILSPFDRGIRFQLIMLLKIIFLRPLKYHE